MILRRLMYVAATLLLAPWWNAAPLEAQTMTTGSIRGVVTNPKNAIVPNADVVLTNNAKGTVEAVKTSLSGTYQFGLLDPGSYTITVTYTGFQTVTKIVTVPLGEAVSVDFQLSLQPQGPIRAQAASLLRKQNGNAVSTLSRLQVLQIPNPGNDMTYLAQFSPGTVMNTTAGSTDSPEQATGNFSNYGMPATSNRFSVDGLEELEPLKTVNYSGPSRNMLGTNEVQDVSVVSNDYSGTYGELAGAGVDYVTTSGGNSLHGNATYFWNQRFLNANDFFNNSDNVPRPFDGQNQWQASVGGPLKKDKAFFYVDAEGLRVLVPETANVVVPSPEFQTATTTNLDELDEGDVASFYQSSIFTPITEAPDWLYAADNQPAGSVILPGTTVPTPTGDGCKNFDLDSTFYGGAAQPCAYGFTSSQDALTTDYFVDGRIDVNIGGKDRLFGRYQRDWGTQSAYIDPFTTSFNVISHQPEDLGELGWTHDFGTSAANQFLLGTQYYSEILQPANQSAGLNFPATLVMDDMTFFNTAPNLCANAPLGNGLPVFFGGESCALPQGYATTNFEVSDDFSKVAGDTTIKIGGQFRRVDISDHDFGTLQKGLVNITNIDSFFEGGEPGDMITQAFPQATAEPVAYFTAGGYVEDDWRFSKTLTLTFALRVEHDSNPICRNLCFAQLAGPFNSIATGTNQSQLDLIPYNQAIKINQLHAFSGLQNRLFQPRFSFAWQPFGSSSKTVVRGGAGIFYNMFPPQVVDYFAKNPPLDPVFTTTGTSTGDWLVPIATAGVGAPSIFGDVATENTNFQDGFYTGETAQTIIGTNPEFGNEAQNDESTVLGLFTSEAQTKVPEYQKWSLELQHELASTTSVTLSYVGNHGIHEPLIDNSANAFSVGDVTQALPSDPRFGEVTVLYSGGTSHYDGGTISVTHRINHFGTGVIQGSYTYGRALDEVSNGGFDAFSPTSLMNPQDPVDFQGSYGPADYDVRHTGNVNGVWELPIRSLTGRHAPAALVDGWQLSGAFFARSGFPYSVIDSETSALFAMSNNYFSQMLPVFQGGPTSCQMTPSGPACLASPSAPPTANCPPTETNALVCEFAEEGTFPPGERNLFRGLPFVNFDAALMKTTRLSFWEGARFALGVQVYNVLNHPNFGLPVNDYSSPSFGEILNTVSSPTSIYGSFLGGDGSPRSIQFKAQFTF